MQLKIPQLLKEPITVAAAVAAALGHALGFGPITAVVGVLWSSISTVFTFLSISAFTLAGRIAWLPEGPLTAAALVAGFAYAAKLGDRILDRITDRL